MGIFFLNEKRKKQKTVQGITMSSESRGSGSQERRGRATPDDYIFGKLIGEGSFSSVFLAKDVKLNKEVAIKVCEQRQIIKEKKTEYITRERDILKKIIDHWDNNFPYFVSLYAAFKDHQRLYFVMTYAKNGDLLGLISKLTAKAIDCTQFYAGELIAAVEFLHNQGIIHRDLKPENILLNEKMHLMITDFGSAKLINRRRRRRRTGDNREEPVESDDALEETSDEDGADGAAPPKSKRSSFVGTPEYVSPEIFTSRGSSRASDLWAIGCIIYQMISGIPPFQSKSEYMIFKKIEKLDYSFHEGFDEHAKDLVKRLLVIEPKDRIGARDKTYYSSIRDHPFFKGLDIDKLHQSTPACLETFVKDADVPDQIWAKHPDRKPGVEPMLKLMVEPTSSDEELLNIGTEDSPDGVPKNSPYLQIPTSSRRSKKSVLKPLTEFTEEERSDKLKQQALTNDFHRFVEGHLILKQGILDKKKGLFAKRRMFLLTEGPHLYYVDPSDMVLKGEIPWSSDLATEIRDFRIFFVKTPGRNYYLIDPDSTSKDWCMAIDELKDFYYAATADNTVVDHSSQQVSSTTS